MIGLLRSILFIGAAAYLGILLYMYLQQRSLQYFPSREGLSPQAVGLTGVSEERVNTPDGETIVLWYAEPKPGHPTILFFHGNGGEISGRHDRMASTSHKASARCSSPTAAMAPAPGRSPSRDS
jgi:uncharacterized protein